MSAAASANSGDHVTAAVSWRYLHGGKVVHALPEQVSGREHARCGTAPSWFSPDGWFGTGSQVEYETVERLPRCGRCTRLLAGDARHRLPWGPRGEAS